MLTVVPPAGFEPTTFWFEARHSNPLSYGGVSTSIITDTFRKVMVRFLILRYGRAYAKLRGVYQ